MPSNDSFWFKGRQSPALEGIWQPPKSLEIADPEIPYLPLMTEVTLALTGTIIGATQSDIVAGGKTIILTLTGDTWVAAGATFDAQRAGIIAGMDSAQSELLGWDNVVKALQGVSGVVRTSDTVVTITLDAQITYSITANETVTVTVPGTALTRMAAEVAAPPFVITPAAVTDVFFALMQRIRHGVIAQTASGMGGVLVE